MAIDAALKDVESGRTLAVPEHLRDASYKGAKRLGHGQATSTRTITRAFRRAGLSGRGQALLRADRAGGGEERTTANFMKKKIKERVEKWRARVPGTDRIIFRFVGFATADTNEHATKQKEQEPSHSAAFHVRRPDARG
jgi:hypothetical protein